MFSVSLKFQNQISIKFISWKKQKKIRAGLFCRSQSHQKYSLLRIWTSEKNPIQKFS